MQFTIYMGVWTLVLTYMLLILLKFFKNSYSLFLNSGDKLLKRYLNYKYSTGRHFKEKNTILNKIFSLAVSSSLLHNPLL